MCLQNNITLVQVVLRYVKKCFGFKYLDVPANVTKSRHYIRIIAVTLYFFVDSICMVSRPNLYEKNGREVQSQFNGVFFPIDRVKLVSLAVTSLDSCHGQWEPRLSIYACHQPRDKTVRLFTRAIQ